MNYYIILLLAVIQGLAELLPVSSSAHVIFAGKLLHLDPGSPQFMFLLIMLHTGTMFAVILYFWSSWKAILFPSPQEKADTVSGGRWNYILMIIVATGCTLILGLGLKYLIENVILEKIMHHDKGEVEHLARDLRFVGAALFAAGVVILLSSFFDRLGPGGRLTAAIAIAIGLIQGLTLPFRGFSRSGATISVGLFCGLPRRFVEQFSFALGVVITPIAIGYLGFKLYKAEQAAEIKTNMVDLLAPGLVGMVFSFLAGLVALRLLSAILEHGHWRFFAWYCFLAAGVMFFAHYQLPPG